MLSKYVRITRRSGCTAWSFRDPTEQFEEGAIVVPYDDRDASGVLRLFRIPRKTEEKKL